MEGPKIHAAAHDPNATLILPIDDDDREAKIDGIVKPFLAGRQKALDKSVNIPMSLL